MAAKASRSSGSGRVDDAGRGLAPELKTLVKTAVSLRRSTINFPSCGPASAPVSAQNKPLATSVASSCCGALSCSSERRSKLTFMKRQLLSFRRAFRYIDNFYWGSGITNDVPALSYYLVLSLAPFTLGLAVLSALIFGADLQAADIAHTVARFLPPSVRGSVVKLVLTTKHDSTRLLILAVLAMLWTGSSAIGVIERVLARLTGARRHRVVHWRLHNMALGAVLCLLLLLAIGIASLAAGLKAYLPHEVDLLGIPLLLLDVAGAVFFCGLIFRYATRDGVCWRAALAGALPAALMLQIAPLLVGLYFHALARPVAASIFISFAVVLLGCFVLAVGLLVGAGVCARMQKRLVPPPPSS